MTMPWGDPDQPPTFDAAEVQHELTRFERRPVNGRPPVVHLDRARDVQHARDTGRRLAQQSPVRPLGLDRPDPATSLLWVAGLLVFVLICAALGLAHLAVWIALHWRGILELGALGWAASLMLRQRRRRAVRR